MAGRRIYPGQFAGNKPNITSGKYKTGEAIIPGSLVVLDANGELTLCGADPTSVRGVALEGAGTRPGFDMANSPVVVTGRSQELSYADADRSTKFTMRGVNGGTDPVTPTQTHVGEAYGVVKDADGIWALDLADAVNQVFIIADIDIDNKVFICRFKESVIQVP